MRQGRPGADPRGVVRLPDRRRRARAGVRRGRAGADRDAADLAERVEIVEGDAAAFPLEPEAWDAALCLGASFVWHGLDGTLEALAPAVRPGGNVVVGEPFWRTWPLPEGIDDLGYLPLRETVARFESAGLALVSLIASSEDDWDTYESLHWRAARGVARRASGRSRRAEDPRPARGVARRVSPPRARPVRVGDLRRPEARRKASVKRRRPDSGCLRGFPRAAALRRPPSAVEGADGDELRHEHAVQRRHRGGVPARRSRLARARLEDRADPRSVDGRDDPGARRAGAAAVDARDLDANRRHRRGGGRRGRRSPLAPRPDRRRPRRRSRGLGHASVLALRRAARHRPAALHGAGGQPRLARLAPAGLRPARPHRRRLGREGDRVRRRTAQPRPGAARALRELAAAARPADGTRVDPRDDPRGSSAHRSSARARVLRDLRAIRRARCPRRVLPRLHAHLVGRAPASAARHRRDADLRRADARVERRRDRGARPVARRDRRQRLRVRRRRAGGLGHPARGEPPARGALRARGPADRSRGRHGTARGRRDPRPRGALRACGRRPGLRRGARARRADPRLRERRGRAAAGLRRDRGRPRRGSATRRADDRRACAARSD